MSDSPVPPRFAAAPARPSGEAPEETEDPEIEASCSSVPRTDCELEALLDFEPVPRQVKRRNGWTPELQRQFIRLIVEKGSPQRAAEAMRKRLSGIEALYREEGADSFRAAWDGAVDLAAERDLAKARARIAAGEPAEPPHRRRQKFAPAAGPLPGQMLNEHGEWEDEESIMRRVENARDSISAKLLRCRRLYLQEISSSPGKRAAFEILTELPIDWGKAERLEAQADEPWRKPNMRKPDILLTAENGWMGDITHGSNRMAEAREALNEELVQQGKPPIDWSQDGADKVEAQSCRGHDEHSTGAQSCRDGGAQPVPQTGAHRHDEHSTAELRASPAEQPSSSYPSLSPTPPDQSEPRIRGL